MPCDRCRVQSLSPVIVTSGEPDDPGSDAARPGGVGFEPRTGAGDMVPLNDPVGGWVYWNRIPLGGIAGGLGNAGPLAICYGADALGGAVYLTTAHGSGGAAARRGRRSRYRHASAYGGEWRQPVFGAAEGFDDRRLRHRRSGSARTDRYAATSRHASGLFGASSRIPVVPSSRFGRSHFDESATERHAGTAQRDAH